MRLPQYLYIAGPGDSAAQLAARLDMDSIRITIDLDEAPEEFRKLFLPHDTLDKCIEMLYKLDPFALGNAGNEMLQLRCDHDPQVEAIIYPIRRYSDIVPFMKGTPRSDHLLINMHSGSIEVDRPSPCSVLSFAPSGNADEDFSMLQHEFANSMRAIS